MIHFGISSADPTIEVAFREQPCLREPGGKLYTFAVNAHDEYGASVAIDVTSRRPIKLTASHWQHEDPRGACVAAADDLLDALKLVLPYAETRAEDIEEMVENGNGGDADLARKAAEAVNAARSLVARLEQRRATAEHQRTTASEA